MSQQITESFVQQYGANIFHLSQQKGSQLRPTVRSESQKGKSRFYDRIGATEAVKKTGRHSSTPLIETPHSRRMVTLEDFEMADLVDDQDKIRTLNDPTNDYVMAFMWAMGRSMDSVIIAAMGGNSYGGEDGTVVIPLPNAQKFAANNGTAFTNLNVLTLRKLRTKFKKANVDKSIPLYFACDPAQIESMLAQLEVTSSDYNSVKALVQGEVDSFMGFKFVDLTLLPVQVSALLADPTTGVVGAGSSVVGFRKCYAYAGGPMGGPLLSIGQDYQARISERDDKSYATQVYAKMTIGGTRLEEEKVIEVLCKES